jgi:hypothetical protein
MYLAPTSLIDAVGTIIRLCSSGKLHQLYYQLYYSTTLMMRTMIRVEIQSRGKRHVHQQVTVNLGDFSSRDDNSDDSEDSSSYASTTSKDSYDSDDTFIASSDESLSYEEESEGTMIENNRWVVPYNLYFLKKYRSHINVDVENCNAVQSVKYLFLYHFKGADMVTIEDEDMFDEVKKFTTQRYISACYAYWRIVRSKEDTMLTYFQEYSPKGSL